MVPDPLNYPLACTALEGYEVQVADAMPQGGDSVQGCPPLDSTGRNDGERGQTRMARASAVVGRDGAGMHGGRSASQRRSTGQDRGREVAALATLDKLSRGVLLLDCDGTVIFANRAAQAMAARNDGLDLTSDRLRFRCQSTQTALDAFLVGRASGGCESVVLRTTGRSNATPYRVLVSRLEHHTGYSVFVYEPSGGQKPLPVGVLRCLYGLTPAEARLTNELFTGKTLAEAARACGIRLNTAKYTLKSVFSKCEVKSRAELMLLLSLGPRTL